MLIKAVRSDIRGVKVELHKYIIYPNLIILECYLFLTLNSCIYFASPLRTGTCNFLPFIHF
jgi:hypothetical protein